jgi:hypothetical protein
MEAIVRRSREAPGQRVEVHDGERRSLTLEEVDDLQRNAGLADPDRAADDKYRDLLQSRYSCSLSTMV